MTIIKSIMVFWDNQDSDNEGWAYRVTEANGTQQDGPLEDYKQLPDNANGSALQGAVASIAWQYGSELDDGDIAVDLKTEGGFAIWTASDQDLAQQEYHQKCMEPDQ